MSNLTNVHLLNVPIESDYKNTLYFGSKDAQTNYFLNRVVHSCADASYQRKEKAFRINKNVDSLYNCNYVMYQNSAFSNKWFYAFITDLEYRNEETTFVHFEIDVMQTWAFDYTVKPSFIEREHVNDDTIGKHTLPEQLETGEYIINGSVKNTYLNSFGYIVGATVDLGDVTASTSDDASDRYPAIAGGLYNGIYSGIKYFYFLDANKINKKLTSLAKKGQSDAVTCIFCASANCFSTTSSGDTYAVDFSNDVKSFNWNPGVFGYTQEEVKKPTSINGYTPKNQKLFTFPYSYILMSNNSGNSAVYKYELFEDNAEKICDFKINSAITPGFSIRLIPKNYNGKELNNEEGLNLGKLPICNWNTDVFTNWLTQNSVNIPLQFASSAISIAGGIGLMASGGGALAGGGSVVGGVMGIASTIGEIYQHSFQPPQASGNLNSGDVTYSQGDLTFIAYHMSIKKEYAKIIDGFFDMFGYKVSAVKTPNKNHRKNYWYTKTIDINIDGAIPNKDLQQIKNCYNAGITFWRSGSDVGNYSVDNSII